MMELVQLTKEELYIIAKVLDNEILIYNIEANWARASEISKIHKIISKIKFSLGLFKKDEIIESNKNKNV